MLNVITNKNHFVIYNEVHIKITTTVTYHMLNNDILEMTGNNTLHYLHPMHKIISTKYKKLNISKQFIVCLETHSIGFKWRFTHF